MASTSNTLLTSKPAWGFNSTIDHHADPAAAWPVAITAIADATYQPGEAVRAFLDSRYGRHFADDVSNELTAGKCLSGAIAAATARWMGWKISARTTHETGIPRGLPYLTGFVIHAEIEASSAD